MKLRFSIRTLLAVMVVVGVATVVGVKWWTTPYTVIETRKSFSYEYKLQKKLNGDIVHVGTVKHNGVEFDFDGQSATRFVGDDGMLTKEGETLTIRRLSRAFNPEGLNRGSGELRKFLDSEEIKRPILNPKPD